MDQDALPSFFTRSACCRTLMPLAASLWLVGCAQLPDAPPKAELKAVESYGASKLPLNAEVVWPTQQWWRSYGDSQLNTLIDEALANSPDMTIAAARLRSAEARGQQARSALLPQLSASATASQQRQSYNYLLPREMSPIGWKEYGQATLDLSWDLDFWGKNRASLAAATSVIEATRAEQYQAQLELSAAVAMAYANLAQYYAERDSVAEVVEARRKTAELFDKRYHNGMETRSALHIAQSRLAAAQGELQVPDERIQLTRYQLAELLGAGPDRGLAIKRPQINLHNVRGLPEQLPVNLLGRRPDIAAARYNATVTHALQEVASAGLSQKALTAQIASAQTAATEASEAWRVVSKRYEGGLATYIDVLYAQDSVLECQRRLAVVQSRAFSVDVALQRALGGGYQLPQDEEAKGSDDV
ncbi:efflux transporter outer membrane subunit [Klebsiella spallanzanii]|uniref:efflux transporter outer membrane subunit n=1 Tax=Klebsiella spallanzanii TaxID=2587528 RepID=UPI00115903CF|nr:efflux transporter outer membrane subunit [Klebsiella spallanzanii]VUS23173.1 Outer membrane protein OprM [Klebsiella spallanzanii]